MKNENVTRRGGERVRLDMRLAKWTGGSRQGGFCLELVDHDSRVHFLEVELTPEQYAALVSGGCLDRVEAVVFGLDRVGMLHEHKHELVPWDGCSDEGRYRDSDAERTEEEDQALAPFEVEGWRARVADLRNTTHRRVLVDGVAHQRVGFHRNVPKPEGWEPEIQD